MTWLWIPIVFLAAVAQTVRNAAQKSLTKTAGTIAATSVRFIYGLPFALAMLAIAASFFGKPLPTPNPRFFLWVFGGAVGQMIATALLLAAMGQRTFVVAVAYSKTEVLQVALFSAVLLHEAISGASALAIVLASVGVMLLSVKQDAATKSLNGWLSTTALLGLGSGAGFAIAAVGYRGAALALGLVPPWLAGAYGLAWAQAIQSLLMGGYLLWRDRPALREIRRQWRTSLLAGMTGALASMGWFTAFAMRNAADVRTLAMIEVIFGFAVSHRVFKEKTTPKEAVGIVLIVIGIIVISSQL